PDENLENRVRQAIRDAIEELDVRMGYCSAACGSDMLFAECLLERRARVKNVELHVVLPFAKEDFYATSIDFGRETMGPWRTRFDRVLEQATEVHFATTEAFLNDEVLFAFVNQFTQGLALLRAAQRGVDAHALVVLDPETEKKLGGTAYFLEEWRNAKRPDRVINLADLRAGIACSPKESFATQPPPLAVPGQSLPRAIKAMLFADVKDFSKLEERQSPYFFPRFMEMVLQIL